MSNYVQYVARNDAYIDVTNAITYLSLMNTLYSAYCFVDNFLLFPAGWL